MKARLKVFTQRGFEEHSMPFYKYPMRPS